MQTQSTVSKHRNGVTTSMKRAQDSLTQRISELKLDTMDGIKLDCVVKITGKKKFIGKFNVDRFSSG